MIEMADIIANKFDLPPVSTQVPPVEAPLPTGVTAESLSLSDNLRPLAEVAVAIRRTPEATPTCDYTPTPVNTELPPPPPPEKTKTPKPEASKTPVPTETETPIPTDTRTPVPPSTETPTSTPEITMTPDGTATVTPTETETVTPTPTTTTIETETPEAPPPTVQATVVTPVDTEVSPPPTQKAGSVQSGGTSKVVEPIGEPLPPIVPIAAGVGTVAAVGLGAKLVSWVAERLRGKKKSS